jgi:hypothetical protein
VARASAIVFTGPKDDTLKGATRCMKRMGITARLCCALLRKCYAALRPAHQAAKNVHDIVNVYLSPSPKPRLSCLRPVR